MKTAKNKATYEDLKEILAIYMDMSKMALVERAYKYAEHAHYGQVRATGEPYIVHPLAVAVTLAELGLDAETLCAAFLHDVCEDTSTSEEELHKEFGDDIANLVSGVTKLSKLNLEVPDVGEQSTININQSENLRKMLLAMAQDLRVVFIKLADRLHNMRTLDALPEAKQQRIAHETMEIYAPLAHRLGIWDIKWQLEDIAFRYLDNERYRYISSLVNSKRTQREALINECIAHLKEEFAKLSINADIYGRPKHIYSIHQKILKYQRMGRQFNEIYDLLAMRVIVDTLPMCYTAIGVVHSLWHPLPNTFDDYIATPRPNGYQSLHTAVLVNGTTPVEVQVRTQEMQEVAEYGIAAHWRYKEGSKADKQFEEKLGWLRRLVEWQGEVSEADQFLEDVKTDVFIDQVFVFTPKGDLIDLSKEATPLDFAYRVHTELGHRCVGAKVNGKMVPLDYQLKNGEIVEILTTKKLEKGPSRDWLLPHLGYIKTSHAMDKIRAWFKKQARGENIERGRDIFEKELRHMGIREVNHGELVKQYKFANYDDFLAAIGYGGISAHNVAYNIAEKIEKKDEKLVVVDTNDTQAIADHVADFNRQKTGSDAYNAVKVMGVGDMLTSIAGCCHPMPGDDIIGFVTRNRGVTIHRKDCYNVLNEDDQDRLVPVSWGSSSTLLYPASVQVEAWDHVGLVKDVSTVLAEEKINISSMMLKENKDGISTLSLNLETRGVQQLSRLFLKLESIKGIISVTRVGDEATAKNIGGKLG
ncbi:MAG: bifunctional (p)ppGpp synthetase/guanosine-3',5'-bis(diphosphate) 3'-pyrophosphohydrolase [Chloroflexi bacterium]|nr:bifunctional (p)ppGpp synthetase/guanosine-3',5'-bis(diphosphate) 3'-pyrophosphohydrolase [Chloroflexota bacterium]